MCDVTDVTSKVPTDWSKSSSPQDVHFLAHFYFHRNQITLSICGDTSFYHLFYDRLCYLKQYRTYIRRIPTKKAPPPNPSGLLEGGAFLVADF